MKRINTIKEALEILGQNIDFDKYAEGMVVAGFSANYIKSSVAKTKLEKIFEAANKLDGFIRNYDRLQRGYFPRLWVKKDANKQSGFGLSYLDCGDWITRTTVGARLECGSWERAEQIGIDHIDLYEEAFLIIPE